LRSTSSVPLRDLVAQAPEELPAGAVAVLFAQLGPRRRLRGLHEADDQLGIEAELRVVGVGGAADVAARRECAVGRPLLADDAQATRAGVRPVRQQRALDDGFEVVFGYVGHNLLL
jgi:hypothetical protein